MKSNKKENKYDLKKLQNNYFEASIKNVVEANASVRVAQNWLLALGLAELSFLGAILLKNGECLYWIKILITILLTSFIFFIIGSALQFGHLLHESRMYYHFSKKVLSEIENHGEMTEKIPEELQLNNKKLASSKSSNLFFISSLLLIFISTFGIILFIFIS